MRKLLLMAASLAVAAGCDGGGTDVPRVASVEVAVGSGQINALGRTLQLSAVARSRNGTAIPSARVLWSTLDPVIATVDSLGLVHAAGVGSARVVATAGTTADTAVVTVRQVVASVQVAPVGPSLVQGDTFPLAAAAMDSANRAAPGALFTWSSSAVSIASVTAAGLVRGEAPGQAYVRAASDNGVADSALVTVAAPIPNPCATGQPALTLAVGEVRTLTGVERTTICASGGDVGAQYTLIPFYAATATGLYARVDLQAGGIVPASSVAASAPASAAGFALASGAALRPDLAFERALRQRTRDAAAPHVAAARRAYQAAAGPRFSRATAAADTVGDLRRLNVRSDTACTSPIYHVGRVAAVSPHALVVADTSNPAGGFTDADYAALATTFDTLVYPVDVSAFGAPGDVDLNGGRTVIFFTRAVNELTPANSASFVGGFFYGRDLLPSASPDGSGCAGSNYAEMFYMLVPDTAGVVNGNKRTLDFVRTRSPGVLAHEFQHLINFSRRLYVNRTPEVDEDVWLNEGLSHVAEELAYYRASGFAPRSNLNLSTIAADAARVAIVNAYQTANLGRLTLYLHATAANSPYADNDSLATRGATWQLLRYAADQRGGDEAPLWYALANGPSVGLLNLRQATGRDPLELARDWAVAQYTDDAVPQAGPVYANPSWNYRSVLPALESGGGYPLALTQLGAGPTISLRVRSGGAAYVRFAVGGGTVGRVSVSPGGAPLPPEVVLVLVRTR